MTELSTSTAYPHPKDNANVRWVGSSSYPPSLAAFNLNENTSSVLKLQLGELGIRARSQEHEHTGIYAVIIEGIDNVRIFESGLHAKEWAKQIVAKSIFSLPLVSGTARLDAKRVGENNADANQQLLQSALCLTGLMGNMMQGKLRDDTLFSTTDSDNIAKLRDIQKECIALRRA
jgi:hypothetical protein